MRARKIHPILTGLVRTAIKACDGVRFHPGILCRSCGCPRSGYDERKKRFAILIENDQPCPVHVIIQRSYCRNCGKISVPQEPFYPGTRIGSPVLDLCRSLSSVMPYSRVSSYTGRMGVLVDRWSVRHYAGIPLRDIPAVELFGMQIPVSIINLSTIGGTVQEPGHPDMEDILAACNYPSFPPGTPLPPFNDAGPGFDKEKLRKITDQIVSGFSRSLGIVIICSCILANAFSGNPGIFPAGIIDTLEPEMDVLLLNGICGL